MVALLIFVVGNYISELCKQILRQTEINSFSWLKKKHNVFNVFRAQT